MEAQLAEGLRKIGHDVTVFHCDGAYKKYCIAMSASDLSETSDPILKEKYCIGCKRIRNANNSKYHYSTKLIDSDITENDLKEIDLLLQSLLKENWADFSYDDLPIGKIASYEFLIHHKKNDFALADSEFLAYKIALRNTLITHRVMKRVLTQTRPDCILIFDTAYSVNGIVKALANRIAIPVYNFFPGSNVSNRFERLSLSKDNSRAQLHYLRSKIWDRVKTIPVGETSVKYTGSHLAALFQATNVFVYSAPKSGIAINIKSRFNISPDQKFLVASLSSYDERFADSVIGRVSDGKDSLFISQAEWCEALINWVKERPNYFLLIRVHPREFPNKRDSVKSMHAEQLKEVFRNLPANVAINWPTDNLSIYDIAEEADVFLNAWSSVGVEMSLLGLPVVLYSEELLYPPELNFLGKTIPSYFEEVEKALEYGWDFEKIRMTFRWLNIVFMLSVAPVRNQAKVGSGFIQRVFRYFGSKTRLSIPTDIANRIFINETIMEEDTIRKVEDVLLNGKESLADAFQTPVHVQITREQEAEYIRETMEALFHGSSSRIISNIRAHFKK